MWGSRAARALHLTACNRSSTFFELYGRAPEQTTAEKSEAAAPALSSSTATDDDADWAACRTTLQRVQTHLYTNPGHVPAELPRGALASMLTALTMSPQRRSAAAHNLWKDALQLRTHTPVTDLAAAADTAAILLCSEKAAMGYELCSSLLEGTRFCQHLTTSPDVESSLRFLSVFVMCGAAESPRSVPARLLPVFEAALLNAKSTIASTDKSQRSALAHAVEVLAWAMDWLYKDTTDSAVEAPERLRPLLPQWLLFLFTPFDLTAARESQSSFALLPPRWLAAMASRAGDEGDHRTLERLLRHAQRVEATSPHYRVFQLSTHIAGVLVRCFPHLPTSTQAVDVYGTALSRDALRHYGATRDGFGKTLKVLSSMTGPEPYFVLRGLMRQQSSEAAAAAQEVAGDVLTGNTHLNWAAALRFTMHEVEAANPHWRTYLPETLRLLSDAGMTRQFWSLLAEYNAGDATANVSVAASLAQAMNRSGRWWHAMEVMDLLATAPPPRSSVEESFSASACTDTLRALLHGKRWREALDVLAMVGDLVPRHETAVVSQLLTILPAAAPWESTLRLMEKKGFPVHNTSAILRVLHDRSASPLQLSQAQQRVAVPIFAQRGRWELIRVLAEQKTEDLHAWRGLVQALERCPDVVDAAEGMAVVSTLPAALAQDPRTFRAVAQLCLHHSWHDVLASYLRTSAASSSAHIADLSGEYQHLLHYLQTGARPPLTRVFTDSYVVHHFVASVASRQLSIVAALPAGAAASKQQASSYLRVPVENLGSLQHGHGASASIKVYSAAASRFAREHVLHISNDGFVFGYKIPGVALFGAARGILQTLKLSGVHLLAYNMSAASSGVFVLHPAKISLRCYAFTLHVRMCLAHLVDSPFVPLLATSFFKNYDMSWQAGTIERNEVEAVVFVESGADLKSALRALKRDVNAEGWGLVETEPGAGDSYHVAQVQYSPRRLQGPPEAQASDAQVVACGQRSLQPLTADNDTVSWMSEV